MFVCLENIFRFPLAKHKIDTIICSAGTSSWHIGEPPCENSIKVAKQHSIDLTSLRASQFANKDIQKYDLVVALDENNYKDLKNLGAKNLVKLGDYGYNSEDVPDPYFFDGFEGFEKVYEMIENCVNELLSKEVG